MTPLETLRAARQLISDPAKWTQGDFARDSLGLCADPHGYKAVCFCARGAIQKITKEDDGPAEKALVDTCSVLHDMYVEEFNDTHTHAEILALFDAAIAELEGV